MSLQTAVRRIFNRAYHVREEEIVDALSAHAGLMISAASSVLGSIDDAQDVVQDVAEKLLTSPPVTVQSWPALLKTMAIRKAIDKVRKNQGKVYWSYADDVDIPEKLVERAQQADLLRAGLATLSKKDALLFSLHYFADLDHGAIGDQMDMSKNAVAVALHRLRDRLESAVQTICAGEHA